MKSRYEKPELTEYEDLRNLTSSLIPDPSELPPLPPG
jgi:hypothetical protein